jgi:Phosphotransferase enzyme family
MASRIPADPARDTGETPVSPAGASDRGQHLLDTCDVLWPRPATVAFSGTGQAPKSPRGTTPAGPSAPGGEFILLLGTRRPRLVIPAAPAPAAAAIRGYSAVGSRTARLGARALSLTLRSGVGLAAFRSRLHVGVPAGADTIESFLASALGRTVVVSFYLGPARANRKPVLLLLTPEGQVIGFAKLGTNPLTRSLVRAESDNLTRLGRVELGEVTVPEVLHYGEWGDVNVLVLSALPVWQGRQQVTNARLATAMNAVARVSGVRREQLASSEYWTQLTGRLAAADESTARDTLLHALWMLAERIGDAPVLLGSWHGDWTPWNMACTRNGLLVWDWERFTDGAPLGFDMLHYRLQKELVSGRRDPRAAAARCIEAAGDSLAPFGVAGSDARVTCILYLADLATRYLCDRQAQAGAPLGAVGGWLIPAVTAEVSRLCPP